SLLLSVCARHFRLFFFQAEDGIRDFHVTGVQTCALPIYRAAPPPGRRHTATAAPRTPRKGRHAMTLKTSWSLAAALLAGLLALRSEERRVGKEGRARWSPERSQDTKPWIAAASRPEREER